MKTPTDYKYQGIPLYQLKYEDLLEVAILLTDELEQLKAFMEPSPPTDE